MNEMYFYSDEIVYLNLFVISLFRPSFNNYEQPVQELSKKEQFVSEALVISL